MAKKYLYINDTRIEGIYISSDTYLNSPAFDYSEFQIPGRDGSVILDNNRMNNVIRKFDCYIPQGTNIETALNGLKRVIYLNRGYLKIESDYDLDEYQFGYFSQELNVEPFICKTAEFSLYFSCIPYKYSTTVTEHDGDANDQNLSLTSYWRNDNTNLLNLLGSATLDYPYSPVGWVCDVGTYPISAGTYTVSCTSETTQRYMVVLADTSVYHEHTYQLVGEVNNYSGTLTVTVPTVSQSQFVIVAAVPVVNYDQTIEITANGNTDRLVFEYNPITSSYLSSDTDIGCRPQFLYKKRVYGDGTDRKGGTDLFVLNNNMYVVDYYRLVEDYTAQVIYDTCAIGGYLNVMIDFVRGKLYFLDSYSFDGGVLLDASNYFIKYEKEMLNNSIEAKFATGWPQEASGASFTERSIKDIKFKMNWWKL